MSVYSGEFDPTSAASEGHRWVFPAAPERIVDGDTLDLNFDLGFNHRLHEARVRLLGVDTGEIYGPNASDEKSDGVEHHRFVINWMDEATSEAPDYQFPLRVVTLPDGTGSASGKYGRYLAVIYRTSDGQCLQTTLLEEFPGVASPTDDCPHPSRLGGRCQWCGEKRST